tara:strand:+ start:462 stop:1202 length:741 start_codon:yes stop_codon:yes gene_type:complete
MNKSILSEDIAHFEQTALIIEKNFYEEGRYEKLLSYENRPLIKDFRNDEETRNKYFAGITHLLKDNYPFAISDRYKKILQIKKSQHILGVINLNIDGILKVNDPQNVIDLEGNISWMYCSTCGMDISTESFIKNQGSFSCISCKKNIVKPSIPFRGQEIAQWDLRDSWMMLNACDSLIVLVDDYISPITYSFIEIVLKRDEQVRIISESDMNYENVDFDTININFINYSIDDFLDIMIESLSSRII